jgi:hypothetical protein
MRQHTAAVIAGQAMGECEPQPGTEMNQQLKILVEEAYDLFGRFQPLRLMQVCLCNVCMTAEQQQELSTTPLRQIPVGLIREYSNSAHEIPKNTDELKYILPRYLELIAEGICPHPFAWELCLSRFGDARKMDTKTRDLHRDLQSNRRTRAGANVPSRPIFSQEEACFLDRFLLAFFDTLPGGCGLVQLDEALIMLALAGTDIKGAIARILDYAPDNGPETVAEFVLASSNSLVSRGTLRNSFWEYAQAEMKQVVAELCNQAIIARLTQAVLEERDAARAQKISDAVTILEIAASRDSGS